MALNKTVTQDKVEIVGIYKNIQIRDLIKVMTAMRLFLKATSAGYKLPNKGGAVGPIQTYRLKVLRCKP